MLPRYQADYRTLAYLGAMVAVFALLWVYGFNADGSLNYALVVPLLPLLCLLAVADAVIAHNHNHVAIFRNRQANLAVGCVISFFYGYPSFCWIPTHNQNHHALNNRPGDYSITTRPLRRVGPLAALLYPTVTSLTQMRLIRPFLQRSAKSNPSMYRRAMIEYGVFFGVMITLFIIDWRKALLFAVVPQQVSVFVIQHFNYLQHIETDAYSEYGHSRNFTGGILNALLFNNGFHTVHHIKPGLHWSLTPQEHAKIADRIPAHLNVPNWWAFWLRRFIADPVLRRRPARKTLPAELTPDTIEVTEKGRAALEEAYRLAGLTPEKSLNRRQDGPLAT